MARTEQPAPTAADLIAQLVAEVSPPHALSAVEPVARRADEHAAGRRAAARALEAHRAVGEPSGPRGGRPCWPPGLLGSISHTHGWAAAVVARDEHCGALGLDLEVSGSLPADDAVAVCDRVEQSVLAAFQAGPERDAVATLLWVAKEASFKAWDTWCDGALWGVDPALLAVDIGADGVLEARAARELVEALPGLPPLRGRWVDAAGFVAVVLTAPPAASRPVPAPIADRRTWRRS